MVPAPSVPSHFPVARTYARPPYLAPTVMASTMITRFQEGRKVRCQQGGCGKAGGGKNSRAPSELGGGLSVGAVAARMRVASDGEHRDNRAALVRRMLIGLSACFLRAWRVRLSVVQSSGYPKEEPAHS